MGDNNFSVIKACAIKILSRREHSRYELAQKLAQKGFAAEEITIVLDDLAKRDWQSDARFVEMYIRSRAANGYGPKRIALELKERGITAELSAQYLDEDAEAWFVLAQQVYQKKFAGKTVETFAAKQKQQHFLQYRGFTFAQIKSCFVAD